jgi:hypothetical protein
METRKRYTIPHIEIIALDTEEILDRVSLPIGNGPAPGQGDAKQDIFEDDEETAEVGYGRTSVWDD